MDDACAPSDSAPKGGDLVRRHRLSTRIWHWVNAVALVVMLMSGLMIFNAHPRLYWGEYGANPDPAWLEIGTTPEGKGMVRIGPLQIGADGLLGRSTGPDGALQEVAFPSWATIPSRYSLADARLWHLAFAWLFAIGLVLNLVWSLVNGHIRRDLILRDGEWRPNRIWHDIKQHARLRFPTGAEALRYNVLQKLAYGAVLFVLLPLMVITGLAMSPGADAAMPWLTQVFGGRQTARSVHFIAAWGLVGFIAVHLVMVVLAGPFNEVRAMITGWYRLPKDKEARP